MLKHALAFGLMGLLAQTAFAEQQLIISCFDESGALGAPTLELIRSDSPQGLRYTLVQKPLNPTAPALTFELVRVTEINYGQTTIITADHGRSGYAHIYLSGTDGEPRVSLVDIDLFGQMTMSYPNGYVCYRGD